LANRHVLKFACAVLMVCSLTIGADAQSPASSEPASVKSEIYFGSDMGAGQTVSQQAWEKFLSEVVMGRFPAGLTVLEALGKGTRTEDPLTRTRVLIVVHPSGRDAEARLTEIKAEYKKRFGSAGIFHMDQLVQVRAQ
jgi:hypothetical protein